MPITKMCLTETYSRVRVGENLSDIFPISNGLKQGDALSPLLFNFALEYAIRRVQVNQDDLKLNGTHQLLAYANDVNILGGSVDTVKKNAEALVAAAKEIGLEVNGHKTKYMTVSRDHNTGRIHSVKIDNSSIEMVEEFKYLGTTLTNQNSVQEEIKRRLKLGKLTSHPNLLQRLSISGASYTSSSLHSFISCTGTALPEFGNTNSTAKLIFSVKNGAITVTSEEMVMIHFKILFQHLP